MNTIRNVLILLLAQETIFVSAYSTERCNHDQIETHLGDSITCIVNVLFEIEDVTQNYTFVESFDRLSFFTIMSYDQDLNDTWGCQMLDKCTICVIQHFGQCFNHDVSRLFSKLMTFYVHDTYNVTCNKREQMKKDEIDNILRYWNSYFYIGLMRLETVLSFDLKCSLYQLGRSLLTKLFPCLKLHGGAMVNDIIPYFKKNADVKTNSLTLCLNFVRY